ncbi:MAG: hypothetical protein V7K27_09910 [Nostoc sp.]|uniref:hypothetical protein n=1 Tax=Nostoc sp. TaxID=1180 RepID=UPI002FF6D446
MSNQLVELDFCCPECNCSQWQYDQDSGVYSCGRCSYVMAFDEDDPDYDEADEEQIKPLFPAELAAYEDSVSCWDCHGTGRVYILDSPMKCTECFGTGYI